MTNNKKTIIIGDLHGCYDEAIALLRKCNTTKHDRVIFLGDLVDRGPQNGRCVDLAMDQERAQGEPSCVLGNHEEKHITYDDIQQSRGCVTVNAPTHVNTRLQLSRRHFDWFRELPLYIRLPEYNAVCVHAGVYPNVPIESQDKRHLLHAQMLRPFNEDNTPTGNVATRWPSRVDPNELGWKFWTNFWTGPERVIFGHSTLNKPLFLDNAVGIDGGCCHGRELWALVLPEWKIVSVKSLQPASKKGKALFTIAGDVATFS